MLQFLLNEQRAWLGLAEIPDNSLRTSASTLMPNEEDVADYCIQGSSIRIDIRQILHEITFPKIPIALDILICESDDDDTWDPYELFSCTVLFEDSSMRSRHCLYRSLYSGVEPYTDINYDSITMDTACDSFLV